MVVATFDQYNALITMTQLKHGQPALLRKVLWNAYVTRAILGVTLGLYLYTYMLVFKEAFNEALHSDADSVKFYLGLVFTLGILVEALLELPLGAFGDIVGYRPTITLSFFFRALYFFMLLAVSWFQSASVPLAFLALTVFAVSYTLWSGTYSAWFYEAIKDAGAADQHRRYVGRTLFVYYASLIASSAFAASMYFTDKKDIETAYYLGLILSMVGSAYTCMFLHRPSSQTLQEKRSLRSTFEGYSQSLGTTLSAAVSYALKVRPIFRLLQFSAAFTLLMYVVDYFTPIYFEESLAKTFPLNMTKEAAWSIVLLILTLGVLLGNAVASRMNQVSRLRGDWSLLLTSSVLFSVPIAVISLLAMLLHGESTVWHLVAFAGLLLLSCVGQGMKEAAFDNMMNRAVTGSTDWTEYEVVLDVPPDATRINFGFLLIGGGIVWGDDLRIEVIDATSELPATTDLLSSQKD